MKTRLYVVLLLCVGVFGGVTLADPIQGAASDFFNAIYSTETSGSAETYERAAASIAKAPDNPEVVQQAIRMNMAGVGGHNNELLLAVSVAQNQKLIEQNARIIELLEKQAK